MKAPINPLSNLFCSSAGFLRLLTQSIWCRVRRRDSTLCFVRPWYSRQVTEGESHGGTSLWSLAGLDRACREKTTERTWSRIPHIETGARKLLPVRRIQGFP